MIFWAGFSDLQTVYALRPVSPPPRCFPTPRYILSSLFFPRFSNKRFLDLPPPCLLSSRFASFFPERLGPFPFFSSLTVFISCFFLFEAFFFIPGKIFNEFLFSESHPPLDLALSPFSYFLFTTPSPVEASFTLFPREFVRAFSFTRELLSLRGLARIFPPPYPLWVLFPLSHPFPWSSVYC